MLSTLHSAGYPGASNGDKFRGRVAPRGGGRRHLTKSEMEVVTWLHRSSDSELHAGSVSGEASLAGEAPGRGTSTAGSGPGFLAWRRDRSGQQKAHEAGRGAAQRRLAAAPTHLLMYSAVSCFPHALHLKQPKCQCLSKASRDWPCLISVPQPAQPGRHRNVPPQRGLSFHSTLTTPWPSRGHRAASGTQDTQFPCLCSCSRSQPRPWPAPHVGPWTPPPGGWCSPSCGPCSDPVTCLRTPPLFLPATPIPAQCFWRPRSSPQHLPPGPSGCGWPHWGIPQSRSHV